jgi:hypothetical protein
MATRGRHPKITALRPLRGSRHAALASEPMPTGTPVCPSKLSRKQRDLWARYIAPAYWLSVVDEPKAIMFINLLHEYLAAPNRMPASRIRQMRFLGSELGLDPVARRRMGQNETNALDEYT